MIRVFEVQLNDRDIEVFVSRIDHDIWRQLGRVGINGWLVSIPLWNWSCNVKEAEALNDVRFWIGKLASAYTDDEEGIHKVAEAIAKRC